jgi:hypothetical protein
MSFSWEIKVKGFGPFTKQSIGKISRDQPRARAKVAIYSGNGQGKTCLSRMFRAVEVGKNTLTDSNITQNLKKGSFEFVIRDSSGAATSQSSLRVDKRRGNLAEVNNDTNLLFHVFNSDYVKLNLEAVSYSPSGKIDGFIVGKENIDVTGKRKRLDELLTDGNAKKDEIQVAIKQAQDKLVELGVNRLISEFKDMTYDSICSLPVTGNTYDEKVAEYKVLKDLPNDLAQLEALHFQPSQTDYLSLRQTIATPYSCASFTDEFLAEVSSRISFITDGMRLSDDGNKCPFCGQEYDDDAHKLLYEYSKYLDSREASIAKELRSTEAQLDELRAAYVQLISSHVALVKEYEGRKPGFANFKDTSLDNLPAIECLDNLIQQVKTLIGQKSQDISAALDDSPVGALTDLLASINQGVASINEMINSLNATTKDIKKSRTELCKSLCKEMAKKIRAETDNLIHQQSEIEEKCSTIQSEIQVDEARSRRPKRDAVAGMFETLLRRMFGDKYTFDKEHFRILFGTNMQDSQVGQILSDGEKSIVAFCHYVASTYELFSDEEDVQKLFFVIDDPISSLDYHYVYNVVQTIKSLGDLFEIQSKNQRFLVMTHNCAFFNMLRRNKIVEIGYIMHNGGYEQVKHNGITHYDEHLRDINAVLQGGVITHTIGNSIRQVIEGIWHFDDPTADNLSEYLSTPQCKDLLECDYIYLLCNDLSHGAASAELDLPIDEEGMRRACSAIFSHIKRRFPGQLKASGIAFEGQAIEATS